MSLRARLRVVFVCACLELGALAGVPMRPEQIRQLMHALNQPGLAHVLPSQHDEADGDPPYKPSAESRIR